MVEEDEEEAKCQETTSESQAILSAREKSLSALLSGFRVNRWTRNPLPTLPRSALLIQYSATEKIFAQASTRLFPSRLSWFNLFIKKSLSLSLRFEVEFHLHRWLFVEKIKMSCVCHPRRKTIFELMKSTSKSSPCDWGFLRTLNSFSDLILAPSMGCVIIGIAINLPPRKTTTNGEEKSWKVWQRRNLIGCWFMQQSMSHARHARSDEIEPGK